MSTTLSTATPHVAPRYGDESRPLLGAWAISASLGALWMGLVMFGPREGDAPTLLGEVERGQVAVTLADGVPVAPAAAPAEPRPEPPPPVREPAGPVPRRASDVEVERVPPRAARAAPPPASAAAADPGAAFGDAFGAAGSPAPVGDVSGLLRGVRVSGGSEGMAARSGTKAVLAAAEEARAGTPGRGPVGSADGGVSIGKVGSGAGVARAAVRVATPQPTGSTISRPGGRGDGARLGTAVRSRESQLRFCYMESGLRADPALAGTVTLAITLDAAGTVTGAEVARRSWSGDGSAAAESCILQKVRGWRFPAGEAGGTYELSLSFTR